MNSWLLTDNSPLTHLYNQNGRGISIYVNDLTLLDWFNKTQPQDEWDWQDYLRILTMTSRVYTMFLLAHSN